ncbi:DUF1206 domain-containing protein [Falsiroseomonas sp. E2-1-a20]|uniref:DUF1206 domain-containing protein n=1 Tax=Falsiroseomonas sp. E2-1-a20 TaxID=3239300 RepID=UPI003F29FA0C
MPASRNRLEQLARLGYAARGAVSLVVGGLALLAAFGKGGEATGSKGALEALMAQPLGEVLLAVVALGLFGFALWRALQAVLDADGEGRSAKALTVRAGRALTSVTYVSLGIFALGLIFATGRGGDEEQSAQDWTGWLLGQPFGRWLVAAAGLAIIGAAMGMAVKAWTASFQRHLACGPAASWVIPLGRAGFAARAVVFLVVGGFLLVAAWQTDPSEARGLGGALEALQQQPYGRAMFALVALGLAAFGAFNFAQARFRRIATPEASEIAAAARARTT